MNPFKQHDSHSDRVHKKIASVTDINKHPYVYVGSCVQSTGDLINDMRDKAEEVSYKEVANACDLDAFEWAMGYEEWGTPLKEDWHVSYHKSVYDGKQCYYLVHSSIEWIWVKS